MPDLQDVLNRLETLEAEVRRQRETIDRLSRGLGVEGHAPTGGGFTAEERLLVTRGEQIEAIKVYRRRTRAGLREAKEAIDTLRDSMR